MFLTRPLFMKSALLHRKDTEVLERINRLFERKKFKLVSQTLNHEDGVFHFRARKSSLLPMRIVEGLDLKIQRVSDTVTRIDLSILKNDAEVDNPSAREKEDQLIGTIYKIF